MSVLGAFNTRNALLSARSCSKSDGVLERMYLIKVRGSYLESSSFVLVEYQWEQFFLHLIQRDQQLTISPHNKSLNIGCILLAMQRLSQLSELGVLELWTSLASTIPRYQFFSFFCSITPTSSPIYEYTSQVL